MRQEGELGPHAHDVEDIRVVVQGIKAVRVQRQQPTKVLLRNDKILGVVGEEGVACEEEGGCGEDLEELVEGVGEGWALLEELEGGVDVEDE